VMAEVFTEESAPLSAVYLDHFFAARNFGRWRHFAEDDIIGGAGVYGGRRTISAAALSSKILCPLKFFAVDRRPA